MSNYPHLGNAPIAEALLDIRVQRGDDFDIDQFQIIQKEVSDVYPKMKERFLGKIGLKLKEGEAEAIQEAPTKAGFAFLNDKEDRLVQVTPDGFTFNMLSPYSTWEEMRDLAKPLWDRYIKVSSPLKVTRIALRYINKMNFPLPITAFSDYLMTSPSLPDSLPQGFNSFFSRMDVHIPEINARTLVTIAFEGLTSPDFLPIILDIDTFKEKDYDVLDEKVWDILEELRNVKNKFFFENLTPKAIEVFK